VSVVSELIYSSLAYNLSPQIISILLAIIALVKFLMILNVINCHLYEVVAHHALRVDINVHLQEYEISSFI